MDKIIKLSLWVSILVVVANNALAVAPAQVPKTGETGGATGSNNGVAWPSERFVAGSDVTADCITDKLTGLMWPKNGIIGFNNGGTLLTQPSYENSVTDSNKLIWTDALTAVNNMNGALIKLCGYSDWRLPNIVELKSLLNFGAANGPYNWLMYGTGSSIAPTCDGACFDNVQPFGYWQSSSRATTPTTVAFVVNFNGTSAVNAGLKTQLNYVWPVRGGK